MGNGPPSPAWWRWPLRRARALPDRLGWMTPIALESAQGRRPPSPRAGAHAGATSRAEYIRGGPHPASPPAGCSSGWSFGEQRGERRGIRSSHGGQFLGGEVATIGRELLLLHLLPVDLIGHDERIRDLARCRK